MFRSVLIAVGCLTFASSAVAQTRLSVGQSIDGVFGKASPKLSDGSAYACYELQTRRGQSYTVDLRSSAFDAYMGAGPGASCEAEDSVTDDDGAGGTDARVIIAGDDAVWHIRANTLAPGERGAYRLTVTESAAGGSPPRDAARSAPASAGALSPGGSITGVLTDRSPQLPDGSAFHCYPIEAPAGVRLVATLRSEAFDAYLALYSGDRCAGSVLMSDDDGAGGTDARLAFPTAPRQTYSVAANSLSPSERGAFTLGLEQGGRPDR